MERIFTGQRLREMQNLDCHTRKRSSACHNRPRNVGCSTRPRSSVCHTRKRSVGGCLGLGFLMAFMVWLVLLGFAPLCAQDDPRWLWQDGLLTGGEERELLELDSLRVLESEDSGGHGRLMLKGSLDSTGLWVRRRFDVSAHGNILYGRMAGDSTLTWWQVMLKNRQALWGLGSWNAASLKLPWAMGVQKGSWAEVRWRRFQAQAAVGLDTLALLGLDFRSKEGVALNANIIRNGTTLHSTFNFDSKTLQTTFWLPLDSAGSGALAQLKADMQPLPSWRLREKLFWNTADTTPTWMQLTSRQRNSQLLAQTALEQGDSTHKTLLESRLQRTKVGEIEWFARASQTRWHPQALLQWALFAMDSLRSALQTNARLEAHLGTSSQSPRLLGALQKMIAPHLLSQAPQWETGARYTMGMGELLELRFILPPDYAQTKRARLRGIAQGPCVFLGNIAFHWSLDVYPRQSTLLQAPLAELKITRSF